MAQGANGVQPRLVDDPTVKHVFTDGCVGINVTNGMVYLTFSSLTTDYSHTDGPPPQYRSVSARLAMPGPAAVGLRDLLTQMVDRLVSEGAAAGARGGPAA